ncbi:MAG: hypothetical protein AAB538_02545 [Patescibacteria group bacterium]
MTLAQLQDMLANPAVARRNPALDEAHPASGKTVLSLFDYTGAWSAPYLEAGANVVQLDGKHGVDILDIDCNWLSENVLQGCDTVDAILAAPPCTDFAASGARHWRKKDNESTLPGFQKQVDVSLELVRQVLRCVEYLRPDFWAMENPVGRLHRLLPEVGDPWYWQPFWYGDPWSKKTALYGNFNRDLPRNEVKPIQHKWGSWMMRLGGTSRKTKELRSATPLGFAAAFFAANCWKERKL